VPEHTVTAYQQELAALEADIVRMGGLALAQVRDAISAISVRDAALIQSVVDQDARLDILEAEIEHLAVRMIALRQPVAQDLRHTLAAMKTANNLERCGDLAKSIARRTALMGDVDLAGILTGSMLRLGQLVTARLAQVLDAYAAHDDAAATDVWRRDREIDRQYDSLFRELLTYMMGDPRTITACAHLLFVAKNLERIGDHATNIAEVIHYEITGDSLPGTHRPRWDALQPPAGPTA
jgi:phosphate transport system protein